MNLTLKPSSSEACRNTAFLWCLLRSSSHRTSSWPRNSSILALPGCCARTSPRPSWGRSVKPMRACDDLGLGIKLWNMDLIWGLGYLKLSQMKCQLIIWLVHKPDLSRFLVWKIRGMFLFKTFIQCSCFKRNWMWQCASAYPFNHLYPGSVSEDFLFQSVLIPPGRLQPLKAGYWTHLCGHGHVVLQPGQSLTWRGETNRES